MATGIFIPGKYSDKKKTEVTRTDKKGNYEFYDIDYKKKKRRVIKVKK